MENSGVKWNNRLLCFTEKKNWDHHDIYSIGIIQLIRNSNTKTRFLNSLDITTWGPSILFYFNFIWETCQLLSTCATIRWILSKAPFDLSIADCFDLRSRTSLRPYINDVSHIPKLSPRQALLWCPGWGNESEDPKYYIYLICDD